MTDQSVVESNVEMAEADVEDSNSTQYKEIRNVRFCDTVTWYSPFRSILVNGFQPYSH